MVKKIYLKKLNYVFHARSLKILNTEVATRGTHFSIYILSQKGLCLKIKETAHARMRFYVDFEIK